MITRRQTLALMAAATLPSWARAETTFFKEAVALGNLPQLSERLPKTPRMINLGAMGRTAGAQGGSIRMLIGGQRDIRLLPMYSYARLVGFDEHLQLQADVLESYTVDDGRIFTFRLREGHRWSNGDPYTAEDFRYVWEDVIHNKKLYKGGPPTDLKVAGEVAAFEVIDERTVRYTWTLPNPDFLNQLAAPGPLLLALPSKYMKQFHADYQSEAELNRHIAEQRVDDWKGLHTKMGRQNRPENPDLPTLEAWRPRTSPPAEQFIFERNPYFHRVDEHGTQLPYADRVTLTVSSSEVITAKTATGEADLQMAGIGFPDYTLLKHAEGIYPQKVGLWKSTRGSAVALMPNMNCNDPVWRAVFQDVRVRRALSMAINREEINKALFFGLAVESANIVLAESPLYKPEYATAWTQYDPEAANALLDEAGLDKRDIYGTRLLPDGRKAGILVESSGESTLETDVLELVRDHFFDVGLPLYTRTSQRDILRSRVLGGDVIMSVQQGVDNGVPTADMSPAQFAPTGDDQQQWPLWGMHYLSAESTGSAPDLPAAAEMLALLKAWRQTRTTDERRAIWDKMLTLHADQVFSIGTVNASLQPVVHRDNLRNVPSEGLFGYEPTSYFGAYLPDTFWYERDA